MNIKIIDIYGTPNSIPVEKCNELQKLTTIEMYNKLQIQYSKIPEIDISIFEKYNSSNSYVFYNKINKTEDKEVELVSSNTISEKESNHDFSYKISDYINLTSIEEDTEESNAIRTNDIFILEST